MSIDELLDQLVFPRPNGSEGLARAGSFIEQTLLQYTDEVTLQAFDGTPHGFQAIWFSALGIALLYAAALFSRRYGLACFLALLAPLLLFLEFEQMRMPISGLFGEIQHNIVATFPGDPKASTLLIGAHYDSTTHMGDHFETYRWSSLLQAAGILAPLAAFIGWWRRGGLPLWLRASIALAVPVPYAAMTAFYAVGPLVLPPSPGAIDNAGSVAVLLHLGERLAERTKGTGISVELVAFAGEEERAFGSMHYAKERALRGGSHVAMINLESLGAGKRLVYAPDDGWQSKRYATPAWLARLVNEAASELGMPAIESQVAPPAVLTDARSLLAAGIPALTLRAYAAQGFPRGLHSLHDSRDRLSMEALEQVTNLLAAVILHMESAPVPIYDGTAAPWASRKGRPGPL